MLLNFWSARGSEPQVRSPVPNFTFIAAKMWEYSPQNCENYEFCPEICTSGATRLHYFYEILSVCTRLQAAFKFLVWSLSRDKYPSYNHFPAVEAFSHKFSITPSGETTDRIKKVREVQKRDGPPGGDPGRTPAKRQTKSLMFFCLSVCLLFLSRFGMTKFVITETPWSSIIFKQLWYHCIEEGL